MNIQKLQSKLNDGEGIIVVSPENRRYLTGFPSSDGYLLVTPCESILLADSRYIEAAQNTAEGCSEILLLSSLSAQLPSLAEKLGIKTLFTEAENLSVSEFNRISSLVSCECRAEKADEAISSLRRFKTENEKSKIIEAQRIAEAAFEHILGFIKEGVTEKQIALELDYFMLRRGAECVSFETIAVSGKNSSMPHGVPCDKEIEKGDFITMDFGAVVNGYHSDMTRTVAVGSVSSKQAEVYETVLSAQLASLSVLKSGVSGFDADEAARRIIRNAGYGDFFGHGTGHGVGIEIHEQPRLSPKSKHILGPGDIVTVEPGIYLPAEFGVRIEDMAFITENGCENLTNSPKNLIIL
ncbi:MAG: aminopeptidase P family protein [Clostridia bacterium]|nr:aminopeptidase P family protein [Clostridia bacterium]